MNLLNGQIFQMAYIVPDLDAEIAHWVETIGVGPFFKLPMPLPFDTLQYRGVSAQSDEIFGGIAIAYNGDMQIEIIQPGTGASPYTEFLDAGHRGVHHIGVMAANYDEQIAAARKKGINITLEATLPLSRLAYLETDIDHPGALIELVEMQAPMLEMLEAFKRASVGWDGKNPVRSGSDIPV